MATYHPSRNRCRNRLRYDTLAYRRGSGSSTCTCFSKSGPCFLEGKQLDLEKEWTFDAAAFLEIPHSERFRNPVADASWAGLRMTHSCHVPHQATWRDSSSGSLRRSARQSECRLRKSCAVAGLLDEGQIRPGWQHNHQTIFDNFGCAVEQRRSTHIHF